MSARISLLLVAAALLAACGQTGPLYLPDRGGDVVTRPAGQTPPPPDGGAARQPTSPEVAPQPSTQPPETSTNKSEKKPP
jgi:predicted small lipoprotein YifL